GLVLGVAVVLSLALSAGDRTARAALINSYVVVVPCALLLLTLSMFFDAVRPLPAILRFVQRGRPSASSGGLLAEALALEAVVAFGIGVEASARAWVRRRHESAAAPPPGPAPVTPADRTPPDDEPLLWRELVLGGRGDWLGDPISRSLLLDPDAGWRQS